MVSVFGACGAPDSETRTTSRVLPVSFEAPDGTVAIGGWYDTEDATLALEEEVVVLARLGGEAVAVELGDETLALAPGETTLQLPYDLEVGNELHIDAGEIDLDLIVEDVDFEGDPGPQEIVRAGGSESCSLSLVQGAYVATWGCALRPISGVPSDTLAWQIEDFKTDGYCVQLWMQSDTTGTWSRLGTSCGAVTTGSIAKNKVWKLRLFRTNTSSTAGTSGPPGRYMTIYNK